MRYDRLNAVLEDLLSHVSPSGNIWKSLGTETRLAQRTLARKGGCLQGLTHSATCSCMSRRKQGEVILLPASHSLSSCLRGHLTDLLSFLAW